MQTHTKVRRGIACALASGGDAQECSKGLRVDSIAEKGEEFAPKLKLARILLDHLVDAVEPLQPDAAGNTVTKAAAVRVAFSASKLTESVQLVCWLHHAPNRQSSFENTFERWRSVSLQ